MTVMGGATKARRLQSGFGRENDVSGGATKARRLHSGFGGENDGRGWRGARAVRPSYGRVTMRVMGGHELPWMTAPVHAIEC